MTYSLTLNKKNKLMEFGSFTEDVNYNDDRIVTKVIMETSFSKEIRILMKKGQIMKEHKAPFPIVVHLLEGRIDFGVQGQLNLLKKGDILTLDSHVTHDLKAIEDSVVRLTLSKSDDISRVHKLADEA